MSIQSQIFVGIDPGFSGALAEIRMTGEVGFVRDIPITQKTQYARSREYDLPRLKEYFSRIDPGSFVGIEWPSTRPGEGSERSERFGRGKGYLEAMAICFDLSYQKIVPRLWKGRLGLPGKKADKNAVNLSADLFDLFYPDYTELIRGSRGGIKDGRCDALLIAHYMRVQSVEGLRSIVKQFGVDSDQALYLKFSGRSTKKNAKIV